ncbi:MAG: AraC family transcriptional regulator [bacterium]|nr:AraC family transcriptional regulator [bacterium]
MNEQELDYRLFVTREENVYHMPYTEELDFYNSVKSGNLEKIKQLKYADFTKQPGLGCLSENYLQNIKYHFVIATAMIARYCIEGGLEHEFAYNASDLYINKVDKCISKSEVVSLQYDMIQYFTTQMYKLRTAKIYSLPITKCIDYIYNHLHTSISRNTLTSITGLSEGYLSRLFKKETGYSISDYIRNRKLDTARNMLTHSEYSITMISETLCFASQSYFISVFKKCVGMTPLQYRNYYSCKLEM